MSPKRKPQPRKKPGKQGPAPRTPSTGPNPKQPCPCGSGKRFKACHGAGMEIPVSRPFADLAAEPQLIALREFVPSAVARLALREPVERTVSVATVLPAAAAALVRADGEARIGLQVQTRSSDLSADYGRALRWALDAEPSSVLAAASGSGVDEPVRLQDLLDDGAELEPTLHTDFSWWLDGDNTSPEATATLERANSMIMPTEAVLADGVRSAYWVDTGSKAHLRWVRTEPEDQLMAGLARLQAGGELDLGEGSRYAGAFRAHGLLAPVWDLDRDRHAKEWTAPAAAFADRLQQALESLAKSPLTAAERRARDGVAGRQVTLH